jgi:tRNA (guanine37-N1)-methyltransferase
MGNETSGDTESFEAGLLEHPQYTRPALFEDRAIPDVLLSGDHGRIGAWRRAEARRITAERRPDIALPSEPPAKPPAQPPAKRRRD